MPGTVLLLDPIATNRILMRVRLTAGYFSIIPCATASEALEHLKHHDINVVVCAPALPDMSLGSFCTEVAQQGAAPRILLMAQDLTMVGRIDALTQGVEDWLDTTQPDVLLFAQLRNLIRLHHTQLSMRRTFPAAAMPSSGLCERAETFTPRSPDLGQSGRSRVAILHLDPPEGVVWQTWLRGGHAIEVLPRDVLHSEAFVVSPPDVLLIGCHRSKAAEVLPLLAHMQAFPALRDIQSLVIIPDLEGVDAAQMLDLGAAMVLQVPFEETEVQLRISRLAQRKRQLDWHRKSIGVALDAAIRDPLTGLHNRRFAEATLPNFSGDGFAFVLADLDHFKSVNDTLGHDAGDQALSQVSERLKALGADGDLLARIGGEEFLIVRPCPTAEIAEAWAKALCASFAAFPFTMADGREISLTLSLGLVFVPHDAGTIDLRGLLKQADEALYMAKAQGRNRVNIGRNAA